MMIRVAGWFLALLIGVSACAKKDTSPINISPLTVSPPNIPKVKSPRVSDVYIIQVGAFKSAHRAEMLVKRLQDHGMTAYFFKDSSRLNKVRLGCFATLADAVNLAGTLQSKGIIDSYYIIQPGARKGWVPKTNQRKRLASSLVATAEKFLGIPYRWGGTNAKRGFDCSGLTMTVFRMNGLDLPRKASSQYKAGTPVPRYALKRGDLVFFATHGDGRISHVGIYSGEDKFIHAPGRGKYIRVSSLSGDYYQKHYRGARRYF